MAGESASGDVEFQPPADSGIDFEQTFQPVEGSAEVDYDEAMNTFDVIEAGDVQDAHPDTDDEALDQPERDFDAEVGEIESGSG